MGTNLNPRWERFLAPSEGKSAQSRGSLRHEY